MFLRNLEEIHFVYNVDEGRNCFSKQAILETFLHLTEFTCRIGLLDSNEITVSKIGTDNVTHPLFGDVQRKGWALMRRGNEHTVF